MAYFSLQLISVTWTGTVVESDLDIRTPDVIDAETTIHTCKVVGPRYRY